MTDLIEVATDIHEKPAVLEMAGQLGCSEHSIVGRLIRVWIWFDTHGSGFTQWINTRAIDVVASMPGFADAMINVGWLSDSDHIRLCIPNSVIRPCNAPCVTHVTPDGHRGNTSEEE